MLKALHVHELFKFGNNILPAWCPGYLAESAQPATIPHVFKMNQKEAKFLFFFFLLHLYNVS